MALSVSKNINRKDMTDLWNALSSAQRPIRISVENNVAFPSVNTFSNKNGKIAASKLLYFICSGVRGRFDQSETCCSFDNDFFVRYSVSRAKEDTSWREFRILVNCMALRAIPEISATV